MNLARRSHRRFGNVGAAWLSLWIAVGCRGGADKQPSLEQLAKRFNAEIPEKWKPKIELAPGAIEWKDWRYTLLLPKGWPASQIDGAVEPPDNNIVDFSPTFGFNNEVRVVAQCGGDCGGVKDWKAASDKQMFQQFHNGLVRGTVLSEEELPNGRLMIFQREPEKGFDVKVVPGDKARLVIRAWWQKNADRYHVCHVTLSDVSYELAPVMSAACMTATEHAIAAH
jgi:hypothetical protein